MKQECQRSEEHTSELQSLAYLVCRLLLEKNQHHLLSPDPLGALHRHHTAGAHASALPRSVQCCVRGPRKLRARLFHVISFFFFKTEPPPHASPPPPAALLLQP